MILFFDTKKSFEKGRLSCYVNEQDNDQPKYKVSDKAWMDIDIMED